MGSVAQIICGPSFPFCRTDISRDLCDRDAESGESVQDGDTNLELCNLTVEVARHKALPQQLHTMHLGFDAARAVVSTPSIARQAHPKDAAERGHQLV